MKAIVTGHSRGLGEALAHALLARGVPVLGIARRRSPSLNAQYPALLTEHELDLGDSAALARWLAGPALRDYLAGCELALLLNNAGTVQPVGALDQQDPATVGAAVALNVTAPLMLSAAVVAATPGGQQRIVHVSSGAGRSAYPGWSVYCAGKAALDNHARAVQLDGVQGLRICSLAPGVIDTDMQAEIRATPESRFPMRSKFVDLKQGGGLVSPQDCAEQLIDYLLDARFGELAVADLRGGR